MKGYVAIRELKVIRDIPMAGSTAGIYPAITP